MLLRCKMIPLFIVVTVSWREVLCMKLCKYRWLISLSVNAFTYLHQGRHLDSAFIQQIIIHCFIIFWCAVIWPVAPLLSWPMCPLNVSPSIFEDFFIFRKDVPGSFCAFPVPPWNQSFFSIETLVIPFIGKQWLAAKVWVLCVTVAFGMTLLLVPFCIQS